ncbi:hypothetical protein TCDM_02957 [Trypanosoma cruzi Dm28c]|uniref:Uncharacterized protein n=1 Tax=Trypanosoma cruzi Dm28c TaxID=1416333 RepID=V5BKA0_TRYCR|nr:hypothetical protein TCDM_02957 [Trypanosoma cruzi Dm28c]
MLRRVLVRLSLFFSPPSFFFFFIFFLLLLGVSAHSMRLLKPRGKNQRECCFGVRPIYYYFFPQPPPLFFCSVLFECCLQPQCSSLCFCPRILVGCGHLVCFLGYKVFYFFIFSYWALHTGL